MIQMTRLRLAPAAVLLLAAPVALRAQETDSARIDGIFARWDSAGAPGCAVAAARDGRTIVSRAYGTADLEHDVANTPETVFEAGSVSKQFTAAAVLLLAREGKLSLDDDVRKHVPELPVYDAPVTLRQMMNHTSGLRDWGTVAEAAGWPRTSRVHTHAHVVDIASRQKSLNYTPGAEYLYSNTGYNLLAVIVERVSGEPFAAYTRRMIFQPLGMTRTEWRDDFTRVVKGRAVAYDRSDGAWHSQMPFENVHGNGGLLTTVGDLVRWNEALAAGRVGGPGFLDEMQRQGVLTSGRRISYASGLFIGRHRGIPEVSHSGATAGYRAWLARYPEQSLSVAVLCNAAPASPTALARRVADLYLPATMQREPVEQPVDIPVSTLETRAGLYRDSRTGRAIRLVVRDGRLGVENQPALIAFSDQSFQAGPDGPRIEFGTPPAVAGRRAGFRLLTPDGDTLAYAPIDPWTPTPAQLAAFVGEYRSDEAEATYRAEVMDGKLVMRLRPHVTIELTPVYADAFTGRGWMARFTRDRRGRVDGVTLWADRVRGLRFDRVAR
jgi:CubicO group peptidase (beta-lactamase class C family)